MTISYTYPTYEPVDSDDQTMEEYLGSQVCTMCHRCCPLTALQCHRGQSVLEQATQEYYANHSDSSENGESQNDNGYDDNGDLWAEPYGDSGNQPDMGSGNSIPDDDSNNLDTDDKVTDTSEKPISEPDLPDILSILGLYVGGTYYVSRITDARRKRRFD